MTSLESDTEPLFEGQTGKRCSGRCWFLTSLTIAVVVGLMLAGYNYYWRDVVGVRVMSYNTWGMPCLRVRGQGGEDGEDRRGVGQGRV